MADKRTQKQINSKLILIRFSFTKDLKQNESSGPPGCRLRLLTICLQYNIVLEPETEPRIGSEILRRLQQHKKNCTLGPLNLGFRSDLVLLYNRTFQVGRKVQADVFTIYETKLLGS